MSQLSITADFGTSFLRLGYLDDEGSVQFIPNPLSPGGAWLIPISEVQNVPAKGPICPYTVTQMSAEDRAEYKDVLVDSFRKIKRIADEHLSRVISEIILAVPCTLSEDCRLWIDACAKQAEINSVQYVDEDYAAAIAYASENKTEGKVAFFDLGGTKFRFSVFSHNPDQIHRLGYCEVESMSGNKINQAIMDYLLDKDDDQDGAFEKYFNQDDESKTAVLEFIEKTKCALSHRHSVDFSTEDKEALKLPVPTFSSFELNDFTREMIHELLEKCDELLEKLELSPTDLQDIVVLGGVTRMPAVRTAIQEKYGKEPFHKISPEQVVVRGLTLLMRDV